MLIGIGIFILTLLLSLAAQAYVKSTYHKYNRIRARSGYTGAEAAEKILEAAGIYDVEIREENGLLSDHYDPMNKRLVLSSPNYHGNSLAALGVSAHECGHAIQHKIAYAPLHWRMSSVWLTNYANQMIMWLPLIGMFTGLLSATGIPYYLTLMAAGWGIIMMFNLVTLPVEFDASKRAKLILNKMGFIQQGEESDGVKRVLDAAGWTYVAAFVTSLLYFLYYLIPLLLSRRD